MDTPLSAQSFDLWRDAHSGQMNRIEALLQTHQARHIDIEHRLTDVEAAQDDCSRQAVTRTTWLSAVVAAIIGGVISLIGYLKG